MSRAASLNVSATARSEPTAPPLSLQKLLTLSGDELARQDIAAVNLACAEGLPEADQIDHAFCLRQLDSWTQAVRHHTERLLPQFYREPWDYYHSEAYFRALDMITVLQRDLGVRYRPDKIPEDTVLDTADCFIHGAIQGDGGTCASLPVVYAAVGRRLGYPLKLVEAQGSKLGHLFVRWDDPHGERFNMEATNKGLSCPPDDYYRTGRYGIGSEGERLGGLLTSMTPQQELAGFLMERGYRWLGLGRHRQAVDAFAWAWALVPENRLLKNTLIHTMNEWGANLDGREPSGFPPMYFTWPPRRYPASLPQDFERDILCLEATENLLLDPEHDRDWWEPMRRGQPLPWRPAEARIAYDGSRCQIGLSFVPSDPAGISG